MENTIDYYFDLQRIEDVDVVNEFKNIIEQNVKDMDYQMDVLDDDEAKLFEWRGGTDGHTPLPFSYLKEWADYFTKIENENAKRKKNLYERYFTSGSKVEEEITEIFPPKPLQSVFLEGREHKIHGGVGKSSVIKIRLRFKKDYGLKMMFLKKMI